MSAANSDAAILSAAKNASPDPSDITKLSTLISQAKAEKAHLPDPYSTDPRLLFAWDADEVLREVRVKPRQPHDADCLQAFEAVSDIVDINRPELLYWRWQTYEHLKELKDMLILLDQTEAHITLLGILKKLTEAAKPYSAMSLYFLHDEWGLF
ncbi:MAG: hypothetical protein COA41_07340 [Sphingopyxis sp.]|nr:MAG: hypothetical protein COA41_07340 [Sphingopyxis sp.]